MGSTDATQKDIKALAAEISELAQNYDPNAVHPSFKSPLVSKAKELIAALQTPREFCVWNMASNLEGSAIRALLSLGAIQAIPLSGSISLKDLEAATGAQASLLKRLLRAAPQAGLVKLNADGTYSHTPLSAAFAKNEEEVTTLFSHMFDQGMVFTGFADYFKQRGAREPDGEQAATHNPSTWFYNQEGKTVFQIMEQDPEKLQRFQKMMQLSIRFRPFTGFYDFGKLATSEPDRAVLVDVGGADGTAVQKILQAHSDIKPDQCVVQDTEAVIELARNNADLPKGVKLQPHDFFQAQPVKGAKAYHLRAICHDWSDTMVIKILSHLAPAMSPDSKVLIADIVLPEGEVGMMPTFMDLGMMGIGGKERTKSDFEYVLEAAGLKLDAIYPSGYESGFSIVEASLK